VKPRRLHKPAMSIGLLALGLAVSLGMIPAADTSAETTTEYLGPCALAVSKDAGTLYMACADAQHVAWVKLPEGHVTRRAALPSEPTGIVLTPDGEKLIVTCAAPKSTVVVLDAASGERVTAIRAGHTATSPAVSPDGKRLYICNRFDHDVSVIDLPAGKEVARVRAVREPIAAAVTPDGRAVLVANHLPSTRTDAAFKGNVAPVVTLIDTATHETTAIKLPHGANGLRGLCILPDGNHALVTHLLSNFEQIPFRVDTGWINVNVVSIIDIPRQKVLRTIGMDENDLGPAPKPTARRRGEMLFHDATLCYQQWQSCASCHPDGRTDGLNWDLINDGTGNSKNTKSMLLAHRTPPAMAEGVRASAEVAVRSGLTHILFADRPEEEAAAIDAYLDALRPVPSPHLVDGRLSPAAERGRELFHSPRVACHRCHPRPLYTDLRSHDVGTRRPYGYNERFDTPTLVEVWRTAPYLHDGRYTTIRELLVEGKHGLRRTPGKALSEREIDDLVEFVFSL